MLRTRIHPLLFVFMLLLLLGPLRTVASGPQTVCEPPLLPLGAVEGIRLEAVVVSAGFACEGEACLWRSTQTYHVRTTMAGRAVSLRVGLPALPEGCLASPLPTLTLAGSGSLSPLGGDAQHPSVWETQMPPGGSQRLTLTREVPRPTAYLLRWEWDGRRLTDWGRVDGVRIEVRLPTLYSDGALFDVQPHRRGFDGYRLSWSYEDADVPLHAATMLTPNTARRLSALRSADTHADLGRLYLEVQQEAAANGWPMPDLSSEILAELSAAAAVDPASPDVARDLAELYLRRVAEDPGQRLNYLLLAARELERLRGLVPDDIAVRQELCRTYYRVATAASQANDPASALAYLRRAEELGGAQLVPEFAGSEELFLRWAVGLARQGRVAEAYAEVADRLRPETRDALLRYAPPLTALHVESWSAPGERTIVYHLQPYSPLADQVLGRLERLAGVLGAAGQADVALEYDGRQARLKVRLPFARPHDLEQSAARLVEVLDQDHDVLAAVLAAPLQGGLRAYRVEPLLLRDRLIYQQDVDLAPLAERWEQEGEYALWRIIELNSYRPDIERDRLEQQLALLALREQAAVWGYVPLGGHLTAHLAADLPDGGVLPQVPSWTVGWGETRTLSWDWSFWHWQRILPLGGLVFLLIGVVAYGSIRERGPSE